MMRRFVAVYRDHVSDRNPVREEFIVIADSREDAVVIARQKARGQLQLVDVLPADEDWNGDPTGGKDSASRSR